MRDGLAVLKQEFSQNLKPAAEKVEILSKTDETYPSQKKGSSFEFLREHAYLRGRTTTFQAVFKIIIQKILKHSI